MTSQQIVWIVDMDDEPLHTDAKPQCDDPTCPCNIKTTEVCEACGETFDIANGYYEPDEYAYCAECCHW